MRDRLKRLIAFICACLLCFSVVNVTAESDPVYSDWFGVGEKQQDESTPEEGKKEEPDTTGEGKTIPAGQTWTLQVFITSEHFSDLRPFGVRWLRIEYACASGSGVLIYEAHDWSDIRSVELCAMLMDNVDEQEHFESLCDPYAEGGNFPKSVLDKVGWTDHWNAAYGE